MALMTNNLKDLKARLSSSCALVKGRSEYSGEEDPAPAFSIFSTLPSPPVVKVWQGKVVKRILYLISLYIHFRPVAAGH